MKVAADLFATQPVEWVAVTGRYPGQEIDLDLDEDIDLTFTEADEDEGPGIRFWRRGTSDTRPGATELTPVIFDLLDGGIETTTNGTPCRIYPSRVAADEALGNAWLLRGCHLACGHTPTERWSKPVAPRKRTERPAPPVPPKELLDLLTAIGANADDDKARDQMATWLDTHYPRTPVELGPPVGLNRHWHAVGLGQGKPSPNHGRRGAWSNYDIRNALQKLVSGTSIGNWFDHGGASTIADQPVLVGEPYASRKSSAATVIALQHAFRCPVTYSELTAHGNTGCRITVWFTFAHLYREPTAYGPDLD